MDIPVRIALHSTRTLEGETEHTGQALTGRLTRAGEGWTLCWQEDTGAGLGQSRAELSLHPGGVVLERTGEVETRMVFRTGRDHAFVYRTPYGPIPMELHACEVRWELGESGGEVMLGYSLTQGGLPAGETRLVLRLERE